MHTYIHTYIDKATTTMRRHYYGHKHYNLHKHCMLTATAETHRHQQLTRTTGSFTATPAASRASTALELPKYAAWNSKVVPSP